MTARRNAAEKLMNFLLVCIFGGVMISGKALASRSASQIDRRRNGRLRRRQVVSIAGVATPWANTDTLLVVAERSS
jgi:hypothetical protein